MSIHQWKENILLDVMLRSKKTRMDYIRLVNGQDFDDWVFSRSNP